MSRPLRPQRQRATSISIKMTPVNRFARSASVNRAPTTYLMGSSRTRNKAGAASDPYAVFGAMLAAGDPPNDWPKLLAAAQDPVTEARFAAAAPRP